MDTLLGYSFILKLGHLKGHVLLFLFHSSMQLLQNVFLHLEQETGLIKIQLHIIHVTE